MAYAAPRGVRLCHANLDGTKSYPDCYHLVTVYGHPLIPSHFRNGGSDAAVNDG